MSEKTAKLILDDGREVSLPVMIDSENNKAIDVSALRSQTGYITYDPGFVSTGSCKSAITYIDGEKGILRYRGIPIEQIAKHSTFVETSYLLIYGELPTQAELDNFQYLLSRHTLIHEDMKRFYDGFPRDAHPMAILASVVAALYTFYQDLEAPSIEEYRQMGIVRLLAKLPTMAAFSYKKSIGHPFVYPQNNLSYCENYLRMTFSLPVEEYEFDPDITRALGLLLMMHADHEQNCSTSTVRLVGSSMSNLYACVSAGICALWGKLHGGANQAVIEMLTRIAHDGRNTKKYIEMAKSKDDDFRLMGFGHRVYKNRDPRANILKEACDVVLSKIKIDDPLLEIAKELEEAALKDDYFIEKKLYPNVDFYSGIIYSALGIPVDSFTAMFALGRLPGWIAQWLEMVEDPETRIGRPRQLYMGENKRDYTPMEMRSK